MEMQPREWLAVLQTEYFQHFLRQGGATVKFVVCPNSEDRQALQKEFTHLAHTEEFIFAKADARDTKIHMADRLVHAISKQIDWDGLARRFVSRLLNEHGYHLPPENEAFTFAQIAAMNDRDETLLRRDLRSWLEQSLYRDTAMCQEFRMAMIRLCLAQLDPGDPNPFLASAVKEWLCGELRLISTLKEALIFQKVVRHNARDILASLAHWVRLVGAHGLVLCLDISPYMVAKRPAESDSSLYYSAAAAMDVYEVLRQFIDSTDDMEGCLMVVLVPEEFLTDERRGLNRYEALKLRIWDDVRDKHRQNPLAPMIRLSSLAADSSDHASLPKVEFKGLDEHSILHRRALEALRSGVPNRDAVRVLGCAQPDVEGQFRRLMETAKQSVSNGTTTKGLLLEGGFGTGKSHVLEYLQHIALENNFVCSRVVISKETPLYSLPKMFRAAIESAVVPNKRGGSLSDIAGELNFQGPDYSEFYEWVHSQNGELNNRFAATLFLYERMVNDQELSHRLVRFWSGDPLGNGELKRYLQSCGATNTFAFDKISLTDLALQRFKFASRLIMAAGYSGWILLIDEAEIIGRYSLKQRAKSYAEIARWMGALEASSYADLGYRSGLAAVIALTDDFQSAILEEKGDREKIPIKLQDSQSESNILLATQAEAGMRVIESDRTRLVGPYDRMIDETHEKICTIHATSYGWHPPMVSTVEQFSSTRMREYVKGWITEWDLRRLSPEDTVDLEIQELRQDYTEDEALEIPLEEEVNSMESARKPETEPVPSEMVAAGSHS